MSSNFLSSADSKNEIIKKAAEYVGRRKYFSVEVDGDIKRKSINMFLPLIAAADSSNMESVLKIINEKYIWKEERKKIKKPDRMTNLSIDELKKNLFKTIQNGESVFAIKFANELYLREKDELKKVILFSACINCESRILLMVVLAAIKLMDEENIDYFYPLYLAVELLSIYPKNYREYEEAYLNYDKKSFINHYSCSELEKVFFSKAVEILEKFNFEKVDILKKIIKELDSEKSAEKSELDVILSNIL